MSFHVNQWLLFIVALFSSFGDLWRRNNSNDMHRLALNDHGVHTLSASITVLGTDTITFVILFHHRYGDFVTISLRSSPFEFICVSTSFQQYVICHHAATSDWLLVLILLTFIDYLTLKFCRHYFPADQVYGRSTPP